MGYINSAIDDTSSSTGKTGPPGPAGSQGPPGAQMPRGPEGPHGALTYGKSKIYIQGTGVWIEGHETKKFTYKYGRTNFLYYAKIMVKFKKTSGSPSVFL